MKRKLLVISLSMSVALAISGCSGSSSAEISNLKGLSALNSESNVTSKYNLSWSDEQEMIYAQVSNRNLIDLSALTSCSDDEVNQVLNYMNRVDNQLTGQIRVASYVDETTKFVSEGYVTDDAVIDSKMTDYLLSFMEQTPYYWQRAKTTIRGMDAASRSIVVDVTYKTIDFEKDVLKDSTIVRGDPNYSILMESRYRKWVSILNLRLTNPNSSDLPAYEADFKKYFGDASEIIEEQKEYEPTTQIYLSGNQQTYSGLIDSPAEQTNGTMVVRYILVPRYVLGINLGISCKHLYITSYGLDSDITDGLTSFKQEGYQTVTDSVYSLIYTYFTCIDESDFNGLYKLTGNFAGLDKHYEDVFNSTYQKHDGFSVSLFDITGTHITCGVTISSKERAKGSNITYPIYTDRYYMELELVDDTLRVGNMVLLNRKLEGEPAIDETVVDTTGFTAVIELDNDDKVAIERLICNFSALQLAGDSTSDSFSDVVDASITTNQMSALKKSMDELSGKQKVVFLQTYQQGTSNYASVRCKELYQDASNAIVESSATYEFIMKGGRWYVYNYSVNSSIRLDTTNLTTTGSLCLVEPGKVVSYTSQIKSSASTNLDDVSDISVSFDHAAYTPTIKEGVKEQGYVLLTRADVDNVMFENVCGIAGMPCAGYDGFVEILLGADLELSACGFEAISGDADSLVLDSIAVFYNAAEHRYNDLVVEKQRVEDQKDAVKNYVLSIESLVDEVPAEGRVNIDALLTGLRGIQSILK